MVDGEDPLKPVDGDLSCREARSRVVDQDVQLAPSSHEGLGKTAHL